MLKHFTSYYLILIISLFAAIFAADYWYQQKVAAEPLIPLAQTIELINAQCTANDCTLNADVKHINIVSAADIHFPPTQLQSLQAGNLLRTTNHNDQVIYYALLNNSEFIASIGPFEVSNNITAWYTRLFYLLLALAILGALVPLFREMTLLKRAAERFTQTGEFDALPTTQSAFFQPVNQAFSNMTNRIARLLALQKELADTLSHEIRTPLSRIRFAKEALTAENTPDTKNIMELDLEEIEGLIEEYLTFSKQEHEQPELDFILASPAELIRHHVQMFQQYTRKRIEFRHDTPVEFCFDPKKLSRAIKNLIDNACKYSRQQILITLSYDEQSRRVVINVEDDGEGLCQNNIDDLFLPYTRKSNKNIEGFGLGLAITRKIILWHDGEIKIKQSAELGGANFEISFATDSKLKSLQDS